MYKLEDLSPSERVVIRQSGLPLYTIGYRLDDLDQTPELEKIRAWSKKFAENKIIRAIGEPTCGLGLLLIGPPGVGKTTLAAVVVQELLMASKFSVKFMDYPKLLRTQQRAWNNPNGEEQDLIDSVYGENDNPLDLFILDDVGKEYRTASGWAENTFDAVLRARYNAGLPTIVTTNVPLKNWGSVYGEPMESFAHQAFIPITVTTGGDRRK